MGSDFEQLPPNAKGQAPRPVAANEPTPHFQWTTQTPPPQPRPGPEPDITHDPDQTEYSPVGHGDDNGHGPIGGDLETAEDLRDWIAHPQNLAAASNVITPAKNSRFVLREILGRGGFGEVWESVQTSLWRLIAVKRPRLDLITGPMNSPTATRHQEIQFYQEAMTMAALDHPNIVPVYDLGVDGNGLPIVAMKKVLGRSWQDLIMTEFNEGSVQQFLEKHLRILIDCCNALAFAHSRGIIHRDIKPAQVIVGQFGETFLTDWGVAVVFDTQRAAEHNPLFLESGYAPDRTRALSPAGTWAFMAPEQTLRTAEQLGPWTDIYLVGGTLYYLLTGRPPHDGKNPNETMTLARNGYVAPVHQANSSRYIPQDLAVLAMRCMAPSPNQRPDAVEVVIKDLQDWVSGASRWREAREILRKLRHDIDQQSHPDYGQLADWEDSLAKVNALCPGEDETYELNQLVMELHAGAALENDDLALAAAQARRLNNPKRRQALLDEVARRITWRRQIAIQRVAAVTVSLALFLVVLAFYILASQRAAEAHQGQLEARLESQRRNHQARLSDQRRQIAEREHYFAAIHYAHSAINEGFNLSAMRAMLSTEPNLRGWEWDWLAGQSHRESLIIPTHHTPVLSFQHHPHLPILASGDLAGNLNFHDAWSGTLLKRIELPRGEAIRQLAFSPDGLWLAVASDHHQLRLLPGPFPSPSSIAPPVFHQFSEPVRQITFAPDSKAVLVTTLSENHGSAQLLVSSLPASSQTKRLITSPIGLSIIRAAFRPDAKTQSILAVVQSDGSIHDLILDSTTSTTLQPLFTSHVLGSVITADFSQDGLQAVLGYQDGLIRVIHSRTGEEISRQPDHHGPVTDLVFTPDRSKIVACLAARLAVVVETQTGRHLHTLTPHAGPIQSLAISPGGRYAATGGRDSQLSVHSLETGQRIVHLPGHGAPISQVVFGPLSHQIFSASADSTIRAWNVEDYLQNLPLLESPNPIKAMTVTSDEQAVILLDDEGILRRKHLERNGPVLQHSLGQKPGPLLLPVPQTTLFAVSTTEAELTLFHEGTLQPVSTLPPYPSPLRAASFLTSQTLLVALESGQILFESRGEAPQRTELTSLPPDTRPTALSVDATQTTVAITDSQGQLRVYRLALFPKVFLEPIWAVASGNQKLNGVTFDPTGKLIATSSKDGILRLHEAEGGAILQRLEGHSDEVTNAIWHGSSDRFLTASRDGTIRLWTSAHDRELLPFGHHKGPVTALAVLKNNGSVLSASRDRSLRILRNPEISTSRQARSIEEWTNGLAQSKSHIRQTNLASNAEKLMPDSYLRIRRAFQVGGSQARLEMMRGLVELGNLLADSAGPGKSFANHVPDLVMGLLEIVPLPDKTEARNFAMEVLHPAAKLGASSPEAAKPGLRLATETYRLAVAEWSLRRITIHDSALILDTLGDLLELNGRAEEAILVRNRAYLCALIAVPRAQYVMDQNLNLAGPEFTEKLERKIRLTGRPLPEPPPDTLVFGNNPTRTTWLPGWIGFDQWRDASASEQDRITVEIHRTLKEWLTEAAPLPAFLENQLRPLASQRVGLSSHHATLDKKLTDYLSKVRTAYLPNSAPDGVVPAN